MSIELLKIDNRIISNLDLHLLLKQIADVKYGSVTIIIQDGVAIQIEKNEKIRIK
jgi:hypothetical protein